MKTVKEWFAQLPEPYGTDCMSAALHYDCIMDVRESLGDAIAMSIPSWPGLDIEDLIERANSGEFEHLKTHQPMKKGTVSAEIAGRTAYADAIQGNESEILKRCNIMLDSLKTEEFRFVAFLIYSVQFSCYIAGIEMYSNSVQNTSMVIVGRKDRLALDALKTVRAKISEWNDAGSIPLDEAPFFI